MPRQAKLGQKNGHWFTEAGGKARYFGRVETVPYAEALTAFRKALATPVVKATATLPPITVGELKTAFLAWLGCHRGERTQEERSRHLERFANGHAKRKASEITAEHLETFLATLARKGAAVDYRHKHEVSVRAMIRWGVKMAKLPPGFNPFATVEPIKTPPKTLRESDLPTLAEVRGVIANAVPTLADLLRVQYATGARTGELVAASVGDYQPTTRQIVLAHHKREKTQREKTVRVITLNADANAIVARLCQGRLADAPLFPTPRGCRWRRNTLAHQFRLARRAALARDAFTPYSLRHLWISEALMAGVDLMLVARMAGTSVVMIEKVYGRFRTQSLADAQSRLDASRQSVA